MHCRTDIEKGLIKSAQNLVKSERITPKDNGLFLAFTNWGEKKAYVVAQERAASINRAFGENIASTEKFSDGQFIVIKPTTSLIDEYYNSYIDNYYKNNPEQVTKEGDSAPAEVQLSVAESVPGSKASAKTLKIIESFLERIGVDSLAMTKDMAKEAAFQFTKNKNGVLLGVADMMQGFIAVLEGKDDVALTEESVHFATAIIKETNPKLYKELFNKIGQYKIYDLVKNDPSYREAYRDKEGKLDIAKLKKEAIDKLITEYVLRSQGDENLVNDFTQEGMNPQEIAFAKSWWNKVIDWFKQLFQKANIDTKDPFQEVARQIVEGEDIGTKEDINSKDYMFNIGQENEAQTKLVSSIQETNAKIVEFEGIYKINDTEVKGIKYKNQDEWSEEKQKYTENGKADINDILSRLVDENGNLREEPLEAEGVSQLNPNNGKAYSTLEQNLTERLKEYPEGTKFLHNINLLDSKFNRVINVDFLAIKPDGTLDVQTWNFEKNFGKEASSQTRETVLEYIGKIKTILKNSYGVKENIRGRANPILFTTAVKNGESTLKSIQIGNAKANLEEDETLLPFTDLREQTGTSELDNLIEKLANLYDKIKIESTTNKYIKTEQLRKLATAIRDIQIKQSLKPAFHYIGVLAKEADILLKQFDEDFRDKPLNSIQDEDIKKFMSNLLDLSTKMYPFQDMQGEMYDYVQNNPDLREDLAVSAQKVAIYTKKVDNLLTQASQKFIGDKQKVVDITAAEVDYGNKFRTISQGAPLGTTLFYNLTEPALNRTQVLQKEENAKLAEIMTAVKKWNSGGARNMFNLIFAKDSKGKIDPTRSIDTIDKEFFKQFYVEKAKGNKQWIQDNIDKDAYKAWAKQHLEDRIAEVKEVIYSGDPEENERIQKDIIADLTSRYSTKDKNSNGWLQTMASRFPLEKWYSKDYQELLKKGNEPILDLYNYIRERVNIAKDLGVFEEKIARIFLPLVQKSGLQEKLVFGGTPKIGQGFINGITVTANDKGFGTRDPITNAITYQLPFRFTHDFLKDNPEEWSTDLGRTIQIFNDELIRYQELLKIEPLVKALLVLEQAKKSVLTDEKGHPIIENGQVRLKENNQVNYDFLRENVNDRFYGINYHEGQMDVTLGKLGEGWDRNFTKINKFVGAKILPENISGRNISMVKVVESFNRYFQSRVLALNMGIPISNFFGGNFQSVINAGTYFDKSDIVKNEPGIYLATTKKEEKEVINQILEKLYPFVEDREYDKIKKTTGSRFASTGIMQDILMKPYKWSTEAAELPIIISMLKNAIVIDGKVVNVNKYLKEKYPDRYSNIKQFKEQAEKEKKELLETHGLIALSKVTGEKLEMPVDLLDESLLKYRSVIRNLSKQALGAMDPSDRNSLQRNIWFKSFLLFKNWIPPLLENRIGGIRYAEGTDQWEYGRVRQLAKVIGDGFFKSAGRLRHILKADEKGQEYLQQFLEKKKEAYFNKYGKELTITQAEWNDITQQNIKNAMTDVMFFLFMAGLIGLASAAVPPDDKDSYEKFSVRMLDKVYQEMSFYYNPFSLVQIANGSVIPALASLKDAYFLVKNIYNEVLGQVVGDDGEIEKAHPTKYILRMFPVANNMLYYMAVASDDFAKGMGLQISSAARQY